MKEYGKPASKDVLRLLRGDLAHAAWLLVLDEEFVRAFREGLREDCGDDVVRRFFPRIATHQTDYPEK